MQGGADGVEPNTYKSEDYKGVRDNQDKQMLQTGNMGGAAGTFPGDTQAKETQHRASDVHPGLTKQAYNGPSLSTRFSVRRNLNGSVDHKNSLFEVYAGNKRVIAATANDIFGSELRDNWTWLKSQGYGREVCDQIRTSGLTYVSGLLKTAQEAPAAEALPPLPDLGGGPPAPGGEALPPLPDLGGEGMEAEPMDDLPPMPDEEGAEEEDTDESPAEAIDNRLTEMEQALDEVRDLVGQLEDERLADVDVNVFTGRADGPEEEAEAEGGGLGALSSQLVINLKKTYRKLDDAADELSMVAETYDNISKLSKEQRVEFVKLAGAAVKDADQITGETKALISLANDFDFSNDVEDDAEDQAVDTISFRESNVESVVDAADDAVHDAEEEDEDDAVDGLVNEAMNLRRSRREAILKQADGRILAERANNRAALLKQAEAVVNDEVAEDGLGLTAEVSSDNVIDPNSNVIDPNSVAGENSVTAALKGALRAKVAEKRVDEERESYRVKLRRAYDVGMEMQNKGLLSTTKTALDKQVDEIMTFDNNAFEAFKRSIGNARPVAHMKIASDLGGVNIGVESDPGHQVRSNSSLLSADALSSMWE
jgi:hypothetical protein